LESTARVEFLRLLKLRMILADPSGRNNVGLTPGARFARGPSTDPREGRGWSRAAVSDMPLLCRIEETS
ncbi:MAG: hypothetical protein ACYTG0_37605, partial [Planctomycetota bacterium]